MRDLLILQWKLLIDLHLNIEILQIRECRIDVVNDRVVGNIRAFGFAFIFDDVIDVENKKVSKQELRPNDYSFGVF